MKFTLSLVFVALLVHTSLGLAQDEALEFRPLFNANDLEGWVPVAIAPSTFTMEEGILKCTGKPIGELRSETMYQNFVLEIEWRHLVPKGNAGIFIWADDLTARGQPFHRGIEIQVLENAYGNTERYTTHGDIFPIHGAKMTPVNGRTGSRAYPTENRSKPSPEWNHYRIEAIDGKVTLSVNGKVVTQGTDCNPRKGYICIESEGGVVEYRNARIAELPGDEVPFEETAIKDRGYRTLYTGVDFSGWKVGEGWKSEDWQITFDGADPASPLSTESERGEFGFVFDVKLSEDSGVPKVFPHGPDGPSIQIEGKHLAKTGQWNRYVGTIHGNTLMGSVNGRRFKQELEAPVASGPLMIIPDGPVRFANLFTCELKP